MISRYGVPAAIILIAGLAAGCSSMGDGMETTSALPAVPRVDPACQQLAASIDGLRREGVSEKVEKAAAKKYKMTAADLTKAAQLNRANDDFQSRCSTVPKTASAMKTASLKSSGAPTTPKGADPAAAGPSPASPAIAADAPIRTARVTGVGTAAAEARTAASTLEPASASAAVASAGTLSGP